MCLTMRRCSKIVQADAFHHHIAHLAVDGFINRVQHAILTCVVPVHHLQLVAGGCPAAGACRPTGAHNTCILYVGSKFHVRAARGIQVRHQ